MKARMLVPAVVVLALVLVGCRTNPVYNVSGAPVTTSTRNYSMSDVRGAILQAGTSLGWQMKVVSPA